MYVVAKFQLHIPRIFKVTTLQDSSNRKIDLYSKYQENKLPVLIKTDVTYKWSDVQTQSLHHHVCHELRNGLPGKLILLLYSALPQTKSKSMKKHRSRTTALISRKLIAITYNSFGVLQDF